MFLEKPITIPENPFWQVVKRFSRDEIVALIISFIATIAMSFFITSVFWLSLVGPVVEKIGFFFFPALEAYSIRKTTSLKPQKTALSCWKQAIKDGLWTLLEDVCVHDPIYMYLFIAISSRSHLPSGAIVAISFVSAVVVVSFLEVWYNELRYFLLKRKLRSAGLDQESFLEARFVFQKVASPEETLLKFRELFPHLTAIESRFYEDAYFQSKFSCYSNRTSLLRLRSRTVSGADDWWIWKHPRIKNRGLSESVQVVYTKSREEQKTRFDQFRYFLVRKDKLAFMLDQEIPESVGGIENANVRAALHPYAGELIKKISFQRMILAGGKSDVLIALDIPQHRDYYILEIKVWGNKNLLLEAMHFAMSKIPVMQTTLSKFELDLE